ncbi:MAG: DUF4381 family protein [Opitutales bacterium]
MADIRGPVDLPLLPPWAWWVIAGVGLLILLAILWFALRSRHRRDGPPPRPAPWPEAKQALATARAAVARQPARAVDILAMATPTYLARTGRLPAGARTSEEWLPALEDARGLNSAERETLERLVEQWDAIRFAGLPADAATVEDMIDAVAEILENLESRRSTGESADSGTGT